MDIPDIWGQLDGIADSSEDDIDLTRAALLIAATEYPTLNIERELYRISVLADGVAHRIEEDSTPLFALNTLSEYLFDELGFKGNHKDYYDPRNSFLNDVLERRLGIPITLSLVYLEVGQRAGRGATFPAFSEALQFERTNLALAGLHGFVADAQREAIAGDLYRHVGGGYIKHH